ncbi:MAG: hypothetical protein KDE29_20490 [Anaerolineales bacterium]|nr:hypothetical protein [Anaerolineales bacterium]
MTLCMVYNRDRKLTFTSRLTILPADRLAGRYFEALGGTAAAEAGVSRYVAATTGGRKMENAQCPNCGGYRVRNLGDGSSNVKTWLFVGSLVGACFTFGLSLLLLPVAFFWEDSKPREDGSIQYSCELCGYRWLHIPGTPWPAVTVHPEVIRIGAEKLRQEEEERRRRMYD